MTTRNTTFTIVLMMSSIAAAVAAPELPADLSMVACAEPARLASPATSLTATPVVAMHEVGKVALSPAKQASSVKQDQAAGCEADVTEPYRRLHHGSFKLAPVCRASAAT